MPQESLRKATIADAMVLIIGAGFALASWRYIMWMPVWSGFPDSLQWYHFQALGTVAFLTPLSLTLLVIALRPPRPRLRRVISEPAAIVGLSAFFVLVINTALLLTIMVLVGWPLATFTGGKVLYYCRLLAEQTGMAVGAAWFIQAVSGRCRRSKSWVDISGWVLGACWIMLAVASAVFTLL
jgi:hypothetical protein